MLIGGGGISEAEDIKAIEALLQHSVRTGMIIASRGKLRPRSIRARKRQKVGKETRSTGEAAHLLTSRPGLPVNALLGSLKIGGPRPTHRQRAASPSLTRLRSSPLHKTEGSFACSELLFGNCRPMSQLSASNKA